MDNLHISLAAEPVFSFFSFSVTNSALVSIIILFLFLFLGIIIKKKNLSFNKPSRLQQMLEVPIEALYNLSKSIAGTKASEFFPIIATIFFFVLISIGLDYYLGLALLVFIKMNQNLKLLNLFKPFIFLPILNMVMKLSKELIRNLLPFSALPQPILTLLSP